MHKILILSALMLTLSSCTKPEDPRGPLVIHSIPAYDTGQKVTHYGPWYQAVDDACTLVGGNQDFLIETKGQFERNTLRMKLRSTIPLAKAPTIRINTLQKPILVEGRRKAYGFNLPFAAHEVSRYAVDHSYIFVTYTPLGKTTPLEGFIALKPLLSGLGSLSKQCH